MMDEIILAQSLKAIFGKRYFRIRLNLIEVQLRHSDVQHIRVRRPPINPRASSLRSKHLWRATCNVEVTLSDRSAVLAVLCSQAAPTPKPSSGHSLVRSARPYRITLPPPSLPNDATEAHILCRSSPHLCGLTTQQAWSRLTSLPCEVWCQEPAPPSSRGLCGSGQRVDSLRSISMTKTHRVDTPVPSCIHPPCYAPRSFLAEGQ
jgi:hypothetical protein